MIILLTGDNRYEIDQELQRIVADFSGEPEYPNTELLEPRDLVDIFTGLSLFTQNRLVVLKYLSEKSDTWEKFAELCNTDSDTTIVLVEPKVDKRTKTYKAIAKAADVRSFTMWGERDAYRAEQWLLGEAKARKIVLAPQAASEIVRRRGVEQYQLAETLTQLAILGDVTLERVKGHIEASPQEDVFRLLATTMAGSSAELQRTVRGLRLTNDPYMTMGLLSSQVFALAGLVYGSGRSPADVAKELGVSAFVLKNLSSTARAISPKAFGTLVEQLASADRGLKSKATDPWVQIEVALLDAQTAASK